MSNTTPITRKDIDLQIMKNSMFHFDVQFSHLGKVIKRVAMHRDVYDKPLTKANKAYFLISVEEDIERYILKYNNSLKN